MTVVQPSGNSFAGWSLFSSMLQGSQPVHVLWIICDDRQADTHNNHPEWFQHLDVYLLVFRTLFVCFDSNSMGGLWWNGWHLGFRLFPSAVALPRDVLLPPITFCHSDDVVYSSFRLRLLDFPSTKYKEDIQDLKYWAHFYTSRVSVPTNFLCRFLLRVIFCVHVPINTQILWLYVVFFVMYAHFSVCCLTF